MKILKFLLSLFIITLFLSVTSCSIEEEVLHREHSIKSDKITFDQFKNETGLKNIQIIKSINPNFNNQDHARSIESEFIVNTEVIERCVSQDNQTTYSFKIYPITADLGEREYYNLVYEKIGTQWNEIIFLNKERANPQVGESKLEESNLIYNKLGPTIVTNSTITVIIRCNGSCGLDPFGNPNPCDGFACPTGECLQVTVSYDYVPVGLSGGGSGSIGGGPIGGNSGGGSGFEGIYIPNPYEGDADLDNPDFVLAMNVAAFTRSLPPNLKDVVANNHFAHPFIVDFMRTNGGLTQANKDAVIFALTAFAPIPYNANLTSWSFATIEQFFCNSFKYLMNNPNQQSQTFVQSLLTPREFIPDYLNQNAWNEESVDFADWALNYLSQNSTVTFQQFQNWFMGTTEGEDGTYDTAYWDNPNLTFQAQNLPTLANFKSACPGKYDNAQTVCTTIGGNVLVMYNAVVAQNKKLNTCAIRISRELNYAGVVVPAIPNNPNGTKNSVTGADGKNYIINAKALNKWMRKTFGTTSNYQHFTSVQGGTKGENFPNLLANINGIYSMITTPSIQSTWGTGHADLLENGACLLNCHFYDPNNNFVPVDYIDVWILN